MKSGQQALEVAVSPVTEPDRNSSLSPAGVADESVEASRAVRVVGYEVGWVCSRRGGNGVEHQRKRGAKEADQAGFLCSAGGEREGPVDGEEAEAVRAAAGPEVSRKVGGGRPRMHLRCSVILCRRGLED